VRLHRLDGCAPTPLAHYLKALGVLRLVAEQLDPQARGWWEGERFVLASVVEEEQLIQFFLERYEPTPLVSPWNRGSGFYYEGDAALTAIERSTAARFERLRVGVRAARALLDLQVQADETVRAIKAEAKDKSMSRFQREELRRSEDYKRRLAAAERRFKALKADLIRDLRLSWRGPHREWMDVAIVQSDEGLAQYPALLGTGGADGRLDFSSNFFQRLTESFDFASPSGRPCGQARHALMGSLFGIPVQSWVPGLPVGQLDPGAAGGANSSIGPDGDGALNRWDYLFALEGAMVFGAASTRRLQGRSAARAAAPFAVASAPAGYASAGRADADARGEQWMPLWASAVSYAELRRLMAEGRAQIGARSASEPLDLARAVARLGTARGLHAFQRFAYIERNGQSNLAVPVGRFVVHGHARRDLACLDDLDDWLRRVRREARDDRAPSRLVQAERRLTDALLAVTQYPGERARWQRVLLGLAEVEALAVAGTGAKAGPLPRLRPQWAIVADDGSAEHRLALAFALQGERAPDGRRVEGVRSHWLAATGQPPRLITDGQGDRTRCVVQGRRGIDDAIAVVQRRLVEGARSGMRHLPLQAGGGVDSSVHDLGRVLRGEVDLDRCLRLARVLMALDEAACMRQRLRLRLTQAPAGEAPDDAWVAIRLASLPWPLPDGRAPGCDPAIVRRLASGDLASAVALAARRLRVAGIRCPVAAAPGDAVLARRYAAALAFPISRESASHLADHLHPAAPKENPA